MYIFCKFHFTLGYPVSCCTAAPVVSVTSETEVHPGVFTQLFSCCALSGLEGRRGWARSECILDLCNDTEALTLNSNLPT